MEHGSEEADYIPCKQKNILILFFMNGAKSSHICWLECNVFFVFVLFIQDKLLVSHHAWGVFVFGFFWQKSDGMYH